MGVEARVDGHAACTESLIWNNATTKIASALKKTDGKGYSAAQESACDTQKKHKKKGEGRPERSRLMRGCGTAGNDRERYKPKPRRTRAAGPPGRR